MAANPKEAMKQNPKDNPLKISARATGWRGLYELDLLSQETGSGSKYLSVF
jgi:hypothetical protein